MKPNKPPISKSPAKTPWSRKSDSATRLGPEQGLQARIEKLQTENSKLLSDNAQLRRIFDSVPESITVIDNEHRVVRINKAMAERLDSDVEQCVGRRCYEIVHGMQAPPASCPHLRTLADGAEHRQEIHEPRIDGDFLITTTPLLDERGEKVGSVHVAHDITARKRAEEANARLAALVESSDDAIIAKDMDGAILSWNTGAERLFGYKADEVIGKSITLLLPPELQEEERHILVRLSRGERIEHFDTLRQTKDGRRVQVSVTASPIMDDRGRIIGASKIARDITERKRAEEALKESEQRVRHKLHSLLSPEGDIGGLELGDIIDAPSIQSLMDEFYKLAHIPMAIIDLKGKVLVGVGWQDICTKFHRVNPETCADCIESDTILTADVAPGEYKIYKCKNNMWDVATPIEVGQRRLGHFFTGQFFFADESPDYEFFRAQARQYGFPEEESWRRLSACRA